ncbi:general secretion pathway protein GspE [Geomonas sp. RF6]|uniref:GspE/PulE/PilB domain-containing protein n=1 Tax=Geomonas sp. RF6 TaxID=2897342 RepID=UPI001E3B82E9|nr:general secretion pathway protein GspE [Geomonas sp. RF6]UFS72015.1 general secretion pathway protein GspE [Geomonas sp. RF6]
MLIKEGAAPAIKAAAAPPLVAHRTWIPEERKMKLGELLVRAGKISPAQLEETLKGQVIFGGKLGTNLVEMGYLEEKDLADFLSQKTGVPPAHPEQIMNISAEVKKILPAETVKKHRVVPVELQNRKLLLAMGNPSDFATIDEISFLTGYIVKPLVTPELRLLSAMEKHYDIRREMRYISVSGGGRASRRAGAPPSFQEEQIKQKVAPPKPKEAHLAEEEILDLPPLSEYLGDDDDAALELTPLDLAPFDAAPPPPAPVPVEKTQGYTVEEVLTGLSEARDRDDIARLLVHHTAQRFEASALFLIKGEKGSGWLARRRTEEVAGFDALEIRMDEPSVLKTVVEQRSFHLGPLPISPANGRIATTLGAQRAHTLLIPLMLMGRVVAVLYVQGEPVQLGKELPPLQKLVAKASLAFEILILKAKILAP